MVRRILIALALVLAPASAGAAPDVDSNEKENAAPDVATDDKDGAAPDLDTDDKDGAAPDLDTDDVEGGAAVEVDTEAATHADAADDADAAVVARTEDPEEELVVRHVAASGAPAGEAFEIVVEAEADAEVTVWVDGIVAPTERKGDRWVATVVAGAMRPPGIGYAIEVRRENARWTFASRERPHRVQVIDGGDDPHGRELAASSDERTIEVHARFRYGSFGSGSVSALERDALGRSVPRRVAIEDYLWTVESGASYRFHGPVHALGIDARITRGRAPSDDAVEGAPEPSRYDVELNAAVPYVAFRLSPGVYGGPWLLAGGSDRGFAWGAGGSVLFGAPYGSHVTVRGGFVADWGAEVSVAALLATTSWLAIGSTAELIGAPRGDALGIGVTGDLALGPFGGFRINGRAGYQTRLGIAGGPIVGGGLSHAF